MSEYLQLGKVSKQSGPEKMLWSFKIVQSYNYYNLPKDIFQEAAPIKVSKSGGGAGGGCSIGDRNTPWHSGLIELLLSLIAFFIFRKPKTHKL